MEREREVQRVLLLGPIPEHEGGTSTGGVATHVAELAPAMARAGVRVAVYADNSPPHQGRILRDWGPLYGRVPLTRSRAGVRPLLSARAVRLARRTYLEQGPLLKLGKRYAVTLSNVLGLDAAIRDFRPDLIHCHQSDFRASYLGMTRDLRPRVLTLHSLSALGEGASEPLRDLTCGNLHSFDRVLCVSEDVCAGLHALDPSMPTTVIVNGVNLGLYRDSAAANATRRPGVSPIVLFVGRVAADKGVDDLLCAFASVISRHPDAHLILAGPSDMYDVAEGARLHGIPDESWEHTGSVSPATIAQLLSRSAVLVMPSRLREGQPRVIIEAMAAGTPVLATAVGSIPTLLANGAAGLLVPPASPDDLARGLLELLGDPEHASSIRDTAKVLAENYDVDAVARSLLDVYEQLVSDASTR